jgi:tetratricopeptide (TPR) repeat protein
MFSWLIPLVCLVFPAAPPTNQLPYSKLAPGKAIPGLCQLRYRISTRSDECQKLFDQGLGFWYSYVWTESARSFETALRYDPECPMVWWGLSRALEQWGARSSRANDALKKAYELRTKASYPEQQLILARAMEKGIAGDAPKEGPARRQAAIKIVEELLLLYPDDEEAWSARAFLAAEGKTFGGTQASAPYYHALLRINPLHPGANHELVHQYESSKRPALGWKFSEKYIESSPGIPHSWHMQGHLATRLGRWEYAARGSLKATALQREFNRAWNVKPAEDQQWSHHLETCLQILTHQGRIREAQAVYEEMKQLNYNTPEAFATFLLARRDDVAVLKLSEEQRNKNKSLAASIAARVALRRGDLAKAKPEVEALETALKEKQKEKKEDKKLQYWVWETKGLLLCQSGAADEGLPLLAKAAETSKNDYSQHAWGHGAYFMETWGMAALAAGRDEVAEEAFLEALAHDPGSVQGALGLQVLCERLGKTEEAKQYQTMAERTWQHAEVKTFLDELQHVRLLKPSTPFTSNAGR